MFFIYVCIYLFLFIYLLYNNYMNHGYHYNIY